MKRTLLALFLLAAFVLPTSARAQGGITLADSIPAGTTVDHDVFLMGRTVSVEGTVNGNVFILANQVRVNGQVDGSLVLIAQNAAIGAHISGAVYSAALTLDLLDSASLERDLYALSVSLTSKPASQLNRHLFALGLDAGLNGQVGGDLHTAVGPIQLYNGLMRLLGFEELTLELRLDTPASGSATSVAGFPPKVRLHFKLQQPLPPFDWSAWLINVLRNWGVLFALGLLILWRLRGPLENSGTPLRAHPWRTLAIGLLVLVVSTNLFVVALLLVVLIFAVGLGLNALGLWQISLALWVFAYAAMAVALTLLWLFIAYGTKILVSYHLVSWLMGRLSTAPRTLWGNVLVLFLGTVLYSLLRSAPYVGWGVGLLVVAAGMGSAWLSYREPPSPAPVQQVVGFTKPPTRRTTASR